MADQNDQGIQPEIKPPAPVTQIQSQPPQAQPTGPVALPAPGPVGAAAPPASLERLDLLLLMLLLVLAFLVGSFAAGNSDVWLHMASGQRIAKGEWTIGVDPFSFATEMAPTHPAVVWVEHSWLYSLLFYLLHNLVGGAGLVILKALGVVILAGCLLLIPGGKKVRLMSVIYVGLAVLAVSPHLLLRPMTVSFVFFGLTLLLCYRAGVLGNVAPNPRILWRLPLLFLLWANLDAWFMMGPLTLALLWAGTGLGALLTIPGTFPGKTLGAVLGAGLLACVVNPNHVRVFMLPPELAHLIVRVVDVPDFLGAGGRALRNAQLLDPDFYPVTSPLALKHLGDLLAGRGQTIAEVAYYALLLLGLISFVVNAALTNKPRAPSLHPGRFLLWTFLAFLSVIHIRLIPWFAIACAPLTVLNLVDLRTWLASKPVPNWRPAFLGRTLMLLITLIFIFLAWPGWLYSSLGEFASPRRVAWKMPVDPSYHSAALHLAALDKDGRGLHVFNSSQDIAHYCAYFAPGVKCYIDSRWSLFPDEAARYVRARRALSAKVVPEVWQQTFLDHKVDYLVLANFQGERDGELARYFWTDEAHWLQKYGDGRSMIFAWSGPDRRFGDEFRAELSRRAFGQVPQEQRAPAKVPTLPQEEPPLWSQYWDGPQPVPLSVSEGILWLQYYHQTIGLAWTRPYVVADQVARWAAPAGQGFFSITIPNALCTMDAIPVKVYHDTYRNKKYKLKALDFGSPAALLLMIRCARRAIVENPQNPRTYLVLRDALHGPVFQQEEHWVNYQGNRLLRGGMRSNIRQFQVMTALQSYLVLQPDDPNINELVALMFVQMNFLDVALPYLQQAARHFEQNRRDSQNPQALEFFKKKMSMLEKQTQVLEQEVKKQREQYLLEAASKQGLDKYRLALAGNRGLAQEAVDQLRKLNLEALNPREREERDLRLTKLLLEMGRANYLSEELAKAGPVFAEFRAYHAAALGNYADLDQALAEMEKNRTKNKAAVLTRAVIVNALDQGVFARTYASHIGMSFLKGIMDDLVRHDADLRALRGIMALEYGDTAAAHQHLEGALQLAGPDIYFLDRPIAERYLELLRAAHK